MFLDTYIALEIKLSNIHHYIKNVFSNDYCMTSYDNVRFLPQSVWVHYTTNGEGFINSLQIWGKEFNQWDDRKKNIMKKLENLHVRNKKQAKWKWKM